MFRNIQASKQCHYAFPITCPRIPERSPRTGDRKGVMAFRGQVIGKASWHCLDAWMLRNMLELMNELTIPKS